MKLKFLLFTSLVILLILISSSCSSKDNQLIEGELSYEEFCNELDLEILNQDELDYIENLLIVDEEMDVLWNDFKILREYPTYIVTDSTNGIFFNPPMSQLTNSSEICNEIFNYEKLSIFRNEDLFDHAKSILEGDLFYAFSTYNDIDIFLYDLTNIPDVSFYDQYKNRNGYFHTSMFFHEFFHVYQFQKWEFLFGDYYNDIPSFFQFPLNEESLPLLLLLFDTMIDAYHQDSQSQKMKYLKYYVSIIHSINEINSSDNEIERYISFYEKLEGTPRYIEVFGTLNSLNNNTIDDPTHGYETYAQNLEPGNLLKVRQLYGRRIFYHTGAGAIYLLRELNELDIDIEFLTPENSPYTISQSLLNLDENELNQTLDEVKELYNWNELVTRANYLLN